MAAGSQAGYRVTEQLASLPAASEAIGRTDQVTGSIEVTSDGHDDQLTRGSLTVDTTSIASDESRRDDRLRSEGLETDEFPTATFTLTEPVEVPAAAVEGTAADITLVGDLTLHGVTKSVEIPAQARLADGQIQVQGSITFPLSDFDIVAPNIGGFIISIADDGDPRVRRPLRAELTVCRRSCLTCAAAPDPLHGSMVMSFRTATGDVHD